MHRAQCRPLSSTARKQAPTQSGSRQGNESRLTGLECSHEVVGIPCGEFALALDEMFSGHCTDEIEGEVSNHCHVGCAMAASEGPSAVGPTCYENRGQADRREGHLGTRETWKRRKVSARSSPGQGRVHFQQPRQQTMGRQPVFFAGCFAHLHPQQNHCDTVHNLAGLRARLFGVEAAFDPDFGPDLPSISDRVPGFDAFCADG